MQASISNNKLTNYFRDSYRELKKVVWPTKRETINHTLTVIGISLGVAVFLGALDFLFTWLFEKYIK
ncbi:MAG: preprotein translocase subunit SecE [Patescibacteria group bacterium]